MVFVFLHQTYFLSIITFQVHPCSCRPFILYMAEQYSISYCIQHIHHIFFIHSSVDGHLGDLLILTSINNAAVNTGIHVSVQNTVFIFFGCIRRSGIAGSYGSSSFSFMEKSLYCFALWLYQLAFAPVIDEGSLFTMFLPTFVIFGIFSDSHSDTLEMIAHCGFDLHFPDDQ